MSDYPPIRKKIQLEAVRFLSSLSESLNGDYAGSINYLLDAFDNLSGSLEIMPGSGTITIEDDLGDFINRIFVLAWGGGGGGASGGCNASNGGGGGGGGAGSIPRFFGPIPVLPTDQFNYIIGSGGTGGPPTADNLPGVNGVAGGNTQFVKIGSVYYKFIAYGGLGGGGGPIGQLTPGAGALGFWTPAKWNSAGGIGGFANSPNTSLPGEDSGWNVGGVKGTSTGAEDEDHPAGGGGGAGFGAGGFGGSNGTPTSEANPGGPGDLGAGGGGGTGREANDAADNQGGKGGDGRIILFW